MSFLMQLFSSQPITGVFLSRASEQEAGRLLQRLCYGEQLEPVEIGQRLRLEVLDSDLLQLAAPVHLQETLQRHPQPAESLYCLQVNLNLSRAVASAGWDTTMSGIVVQELRVRMESELGNCHVSDVTLDRGSSYMRTLSVRSGKQTLLETGIMPEMISVKLRSTEPVQLSRWLYDLLCCLDLPLRAYGSLDELPVILQFPERQEEQQPAREAA